ncbi:hypothetical protein MJO28_016174 [Puccinia striiformis f. sp. tritici]|uniref:Uncharacterized protein n=1 Tax=Puccinia striiformis f. sp. tritici TaxID=168172 RepID=A0ACC0DSR3_9BASI|nr:hypothetical protein MJO28_016174 [Puccinia striiformis f. sp. tritici]
MEGTKIHPPKTLSDLLPANNGCRHHQQDNHRYAAREINLLAHMKATLQSRGLAWQGPRDRPVAESEELPLAEEVEEANNGVPICCFCDEPIPHHPSEKFTKLTDYFQAVPEAEPRQGLVHKAGLYLPVSLDLRLYIDVPMQSNSQNFAIQLARIASHCQLHRAEVELIPLAIRRGWPLNINFASIPS